MAVSPDRSQIRAIAPASRDSTQTSPPATSAVLLDRLPALARRTGSRRGNWAHDHSPNVDRRPIVHRSRRSSISASLPPPAVAAVAEREPRRAALAARPAAPDRRRSFTSAASFALTRARRRLLQRGRPLDRDAADVRVLQREPAEDARLARSLLGVLERGVAEPARVEQPCSSGRAARSPATRERERRRAARRCPRPPVR